MLQADEGDMMPYYETDAISIYHGNALDVLKSMGAETVQCCVTSPPYWGLRDYGVDGQLGLEPTPDEYVTKMVEIFREVKRVLKNDGTLWLNLGDSYCGSTSETVSERKNSPIAKGTIFSQEQRKGRGERTKNMHRAGLKPKDLVGIPWRVAFALRQDGWYLRQDIIWAKPNPMPESVQDRCTKSHEYIFLLTKLAKYYYDHKAIMEDSVDAESYKGRRFRGPKAINEGNHRPFSKPNTLDKGNEADGKTYPKRNKRSVWSINTKSFSAAHFAVFPPEIPRNCILAGSKTGDVILDPFGGAMTTLMVAQQLNRKAIGIELNEDYIKIGLRRLQQNYLPFEL